MQGLLTKKNGKKKKRLHTATDVEAEGWLAHVCWSYLLSAQRIAGQQPRALLDHCPRPQSDLKWYSYDYNA